MPTAPGQLVIISGPSGVGKSTVVEQLLTDCELPLHKSVSATTRSPREGESDGINYHFLSGDEFQRGREAGRFLECKEPYGDGVWYGTLRETVTTGLNEGKWVLLEIEVDGALEVMRQMADAVTIFLRPQSEDILVERLQNRKEPPDVIRRRVGRAKYELSLSHNYRHQVVNDTVPQAVDDICEILRSYDHKHHGEMIT